MDSKISNWDIWEIWIFGVTENEFLLVGISMAEWGETKFIMTKEMSPMKAMRTKIEMFHINRSSGKTPPLSGVTAWSALIGQESDVQSSFELILKAFFCHCFLI